MAAIIILGSLASPPGRQIATHAMQLLVSSSNEIHAEGDLVTFETGSRQDQIVNKNPSPNQSAAKIAWENPFDAPENQPIKLPVIDIVALQPGARPAEVAPMPPRAKTNPTNSTNPAAGQQPAIESRLTPAFGAEAARLDTAPLPNRPVDEKQMDAVVDRFTQYDIGKLPGEAGERARRDFDALGPEAIPALVRGLNKAAQLSASCPVLVISRKLDQSLETNQDPTSLKYALDNLGRDVPKNAHHIEIIKNLKTKWKEKIKIPPAVVVHDPQQLADLVIVQGIPVSDRLRQRMDRLSRASTDTLSRALTGNDKDDALATTAILIQRQGDFPDHVKPKLIRGLIRQLKNEGTRLATCKALALLVDYPNYAPRNLPQVKPGEKPASTTKPLDSPANKLVEWAQRMELFEGPLPPYRRYRPMIVEFLEATDANVPEATASK